MDHLERFLAVMDYGPVDRVPNWEAGAWSQTRDRWESEGLDGQELHWSWFSGESSFGMDPREFTYFSGSFIPPFEEEVLHADAHTETFCDGMGRIRRRLRKGLGTSMDQFISFPVRNMEDWRPLRDRLNPRSPQRYEPNWETFRVEGWRTRRHPLIWGVNGTTEGFYFVARQLMGTERLSYAFYDQPSLVHDIMEFHADFLIEAARPVLARTTVDYVCLGEDLSMKTGPLLSPKCYREFVYPRLKRVLEFLKSHGVRYVCIDTDGTPEVLIPMMLDAGVDALWPLERACVPDLDPLRLRSKFGRSLRLWGGVDKRVLAKGPRAIDDHLRTLVPLVEEGGFIPTVDHTVPSDVSWDNFRHYLTSKAKLLSGQL